MRKQIDHQSTLHLQEQRNCYAGLFCEFGVGAQLYGRKGGLNVSVSGYFAAEFMLVGWALMVVMSWRN